MTSYIIAHTHAAYDAVIRDLNLDRRSVKRIRDVNDVRGLALERGQVLYADGAHLIPTYSEILQALELAYIRGETTSADDKRTHRLSITDLLGNTIGTRLVTERQAKDALG